jgi:hypothetical protein
MPAFVACLNLPNLIEDLEMELSDVSYTISTVSATASISHSSQVSEWGIALYSSSDVEIKREKASEKETFTHTFSGVNYPQNCVLKVYVLLKDDLTIFSEAYSINETSVTPGGEEAPEIKSNDYANKLRRKNKE